MEAAFLGMTRPQTTPIREKSGCASFDIRTNLWHFYAYLHDARSVSLSFRDSQGAECCSKVDLMLMPSARVLNQSANIDYLFKDNSYLVNCRQQVGIENQEGRKVGTAWVDFRISFV